MTTITTQNRPITPTTSTQGTDSHLTLTDSSPGYNTSRLPSSSSQGMEEAAANNSVNLENLLPAPEFLQATSKTKIPITNPLISDDFCEIKIITPENLQMESLKNCSIKNVWFCGNFDALDFTGSTLNNVRFGAQNNDEEAIIKSINFSQANLVAINLTDVNCEEIDFSDAEICGFRPQGVTCKNTIISDKTRFESAHLQIHRPANSVERRKTTPQFKENSFRGGELNYDQVKKLIEDCPKNCKANFIGMTLKFKTLNNVKLLELIKDKQIKLNGVKLIGDLSHRTLRDIDLSDTDLSDINLHRTSFEKVNLTGAKLSTDRFKQMIKTAKKHQYEAPFCGADLSEVNLTNINLSEKRVDLTGVKLSTDQVKQMINAARTYSYPLSFCGADLSEVDLTDIDLRDADIASMNLNSNQIIQVLKAANKYNHLLSFRRANLRNINLTNTILTAVDLTNTILIEAILNDVILKDSKLCGAFLDKASLKNADLRNADLRSAFLNDAHMENANLSNANLANANLSNANWENANITGVKLSTDQFNQMIYSARTYGYPPSFCGADLSKVDMTGINLSVVNLKNANLTGVKLSTDQVKQMINAARTYGYPLSFCGADLSEVDLSDIDLTNTDLSNTNMLGADLSHANLSGANLSGANLRGVNFTNSHLSRANLINANLSGVNFRNSRGLKSAITNAETNFDGATGLNFRRSMRLFFTGTPGTRAPNH